MFKNLFKPKWQSAKPQVRIQALQNFNADDANDIRIIEMMAKGDAENDVRLAAIKRISRHDKLLDLIQQEKDSSVRQRAIDHLMGLLAASNDPAADLPALLKKLDAPVLMRLIEQTPNAALGLQALALLHDEAMLETCALQLPLAQLRQAAAQQLQGEAALERVIKASKGKDKGVWRICKDKLNAIRSEQQQEAGIEQQIAELCQNIEMLSRLPYDNLLAPKLEHLQKQWQRVQHHADNEAAQRFSRAFALCKTTVDDIHNEQHRQQEETQRRRDALHERMAACEQLEEAVKQLSFSSVLQPADIPALQALLSTQKIRWDEAASVVEPAADERKRFLRIHGLLQRALEAVRALAEREAGIIRVANSVLDVQDATLTTLADMRRVLDDASGDLSWPEELAWPDALKLMQQARDHCERLQQKARTLEQEAIGNIKGLIDDLKKEIAQGQLKSANRLLRDASHLVKHLPLRTATDYQRQLRELTIQVNELRDWQGFVSTPKKEELCREMETLVGAALDPQVLAGKVRRLQDEWRGLGEADKGRNKELWERFSAAADKAYEPCRDYFEKLASVRQHNLAERQRICDQLQTYLDQYDWSQAHWKAVGDIYETAKIEWRQYSPVERKEGKAVQDRFNVLLDRLHGKLQDEFNRNRVRREQLIERAEALAQSDATDSIDQVKSLQKQWKESGLVSRRDDARLWKRFRAACDGVFTRRDQQRQEAQQSREHNRTHAEHLCEQIEQLAESDFQDAAEAQQEYDQLRQRFQDLGTFPREQQDALQKRFKAVCSQFDTALRNVQNQERQQQLAELWRRAGVCDELEETLLNTAQSELFGAAPEAEWHSDCELPVVAQAPLQARYQQAVESLQQGNRPAADALTANAARLRDLCIRMEIAAGLESPADDQARRMALQVNRLSSGLQQRQQDMLTGARLLEALQVDWCSVGPVAPAERSIFHTRFQAALKRARG